MKTILFLGAAPFQVPPIEYALQRGYRVITSDNRPENPGHALAHAAYSVSTVDFEGVLRVARNERIDGIVAYGSDVAAPTAAYVAEQLSLPGNSLESVMTLTHKRRFRDLLNRTGIQRQRFHSTRAELTLEPSAFPVVVKPVDASGSKGVAVVANPSGLPAAVAAARAYSRSSEVIAESLVRKRGRQVCGDGVYWDGEVIFLGAGDGLYYDDEQILAPYGELFPTSHPIQCVELLRDRLCDILKASGFSRGVFNVDAFITEEGEPFVIEVGPRPGGNFIPQALRLQCGIDLTAIAVESAVNPAYSPTFSSLRSGYAASYMIHSLRAGTWRGFDLHSRLLPYLAGETPYLKNCAPVSSFRSAGDALGNLLFSFPSAEVMHELMDQSREYCRARLSEEGSRA